MHSLSSLHISLVCICRNGKKQYFFNHNYKWNKNNIFAREHQQLWSYFQILFELRHVWHHSRNFHGISLSCGINIDTVWPSGQGQVKVKDRSSWRTGQEHWTLDRLRSDKFRYILTNIYTLLRWVFTFTGVGVSHFHQLLFLLAGEVWWFDR